MRHKGIVVSILLALSAPFGASASGDGDLWAGAVAMVCLAQDPALSTTASGALLSQDHRFAEAVEAMKTNGASCLKSKRWMPLGLCKGLLNQDPQSKGDLSSLAERYGAEIGGLQELFACIENEQSGKPPEK